MLKNLKIHFLSIILTITFAGIKVPAYSLSPLINSGGACFSVRYRWRNFTRQEKTIAGNYVRAVLQHRNGDIWFATSGGLSQFNGLWTTYTRADNGKLPALELRNAIGLVEADDGSLWVATNNGVLRAQINNRPPFNVEWWDTYNSSTGLKADEILTIAKDADGNIWAGASSGAFLFDGKNWSARKDGLLKNSVTAIYADEKRRLWFGIQKMDGQTAVCRFDGKNWDVFTQLDGLPGGYIRAIAEDKTKNIWIATSNGVSRFDGKIWDTFTSADGLIHDDVRAIMIAGDGAIWFGARKGVSIVRGNEVFDKSRWRKLTKSDGLVADDILAICEDKNGGIWLGTNGRGVNFTDRMWQTFTTESGLPDDLITAIGEDGDGNIWVGTPNGLCKYNKDAVDECWEIITDGLPGNSIRSITTDKDGGLWVGTDKGIIHYDGVSSRAYTKQDGLSNDSVHAIEVDMSGNVWVGVGIFREPAIDLFGALNKFDGAQWKSYKTDATVSSLLFDSSGRLWVGAFRDGLLVLVGDELQRLTVADGLASNSISAIIEDADGNIWVGTANGISVLLKPALSMKEGERGGIGNFINITTDQGLIDNNVQSLFMAGDGSIWVGTSDGVSVFRSAEGNIASLDKDIYWDTITANDGLASNNIGVIFESSDGSIWLGSGDKKGLTRRKIERVAPRTRITKGPVGTIGATSVRFEFEGGDASTPVEQLTYSYQFWSPPDLLQDWAPFTSRTYVDFSGLDDKKDYEFIVKAKDRDGNIDKIGARAIFHVDAAPPKAQIDKPYPNQVIGGTFDIEGTATDDTDFSGYEIKAGPYFSYKSAEKVEDGVLARWDTREVRDGKYYIILSAWDSKDGDSDSSHKKILDPVPIIVDNTKPNVKILKPKTGELLSGQFKIIGEIEEERPKSYKIEYSQDSSEWKEISFKLSKDTRVEYPWDSSRVYGKTILRLTAVDEAGNADSDDITLTLKNDSALPRVEISSPGEYDFVAGTVSVTGTATSDKPFKRFELKYKSQTSDWIMIKAGDYPIENDIIAPHWETDKLTDGSYELILTAWDEDDYEKSYARKIIVDNTIPTAIIKYPEDGSIISSSVNTEILGDAFDDNFERYVLEYAPSSENPLWETLSERTERVRGGNLGKWNTSGLSGKYLLRLTAWDKAGLKSRLDTIEIGLDDNPPTALISKPLDGEIVSAYVEIRGTARDENSISGYKVFVKPEVANNWSEICHETTPKQNSTLTVWDTKGRNGVYVIKLLVWDETGHSSDSPMRTVIVDNKTPISIIEEPGNYQQVSGEVRLMGTAYDKNFDKYTIEYGEGVNPEKWDTISETPFLRSVQDNLLAVWRIPAGIIGEHTLRLIVFDKVGHQSDEARVTVKIIPIIPRSTGGKASDNDNKATIIIPPNSLSKDTAITVNPVKWREGKGAKGQEGSKLSALRAYERVNVIPPGTSLTDIAYDFLPAIRLNPIKPATIIISYSEEISEGETLALFFRNGNTFQDIGGTVDKKQKTIAAPVTKLGRYALMRIKSRTQAKPWRPVISLLTCQPRVFSPERREVTRISFTLDQPTEVTIKIYNDAGKLKRILKDKEIMRKGGNNIAWDGRDEDGKIVPGGRAYIVTVDTDDNFAQKTVIVWNN